MVGEPFVLITCLVLQAFYFCGRGKFVSKHMKWNTFSVCARVIYGV